MLYEVTMIVDTKNVLEAIKLINEMTEGHKEVIPELRITEAKSGLRKRPSICNAETKE